MNRFAAYQVGSQTSASNNANSAGQNIDWAKLAQEWIQMRDSNTHGQINATESSSNMTNRALKPAIGIDEQGEADMDMEDDEQTEYKTIANQNNSKTFVNRFMMETLSKSTSPPIMTVNANLGQSWYMQQQHQQQQQQSGPLNVGMTPDINNWNMWPGGSGVGVGVAGITGVSGPRNTFVQNTVKSSTSHIPSLLDITVPSHSEIKAMPDTPNESDTTLDAAKRKILPAWLREGLEKMEREKQKRLEREQKQQQQSEQEPKVLSVIDEIAAPSNDLMVNPLKSKLTANIADIYNNSDDNDDDIDDDGDDDDDDDDDDENNGKLHSLDKKVDEEEIIATPITLKAATIAAAVTATIQEGKSFEQKLNNLMTIVRSTLTELLLEVTNKEITQIATETLQHYKVKASTAQVIRKSALATITGKLGLAAYADSSGTDTETSDNSNDEDYNDPDKKNKNNFGKRRSNNEREHKHEHEHHDDDDDDDGDEDSEEELRNAIHAKKIAFKKVSDEIDESVAAAAAIEEERFKCFDKVERELKIRRNSKEYLAGSSSERIGNALAGISAGVSFAGISKRETGNNKQQQYEREFGETTIDSNLHHSNGKRCKERASTTRKERTTRFSDNKGGSNSNHNNRSINATCSYMTATAAVALATTSTTTATAPATSNVISGQHKLCTITATTVLASSTITTTAPIPLSLSCNQIIPDANGLIPNAAKVTNLLNSAGNILEEASKLNNHKKYSSSSDNRHKNSDGDSKRSRRKRRRSKRRERSRSRDGRKRVKRHTSSNRSTSIASTSPSKSFSKSDASSSVSSELSYSSSNSPHSKLSSSKLQRRYHKFHRTKSSSRHNEKRHSHHSHSHSRSHSSYSSTRRNDDKVHKQTTERKRHHHHHRYKSSDTDDQYDDHDDNDKRRHRRHHHRNSTSRSHSHRSSSKRDKSRSHSRSSHSSRRRHGYPH